MKRALLGLVVAGAAAAPALVRADPYRLRADALVQARDPTGVLILDGQGEVTPELGVEVYLWGGAGGEPSPELDLLVAALTYVDAAGRGEVRAGRLLVTSGALRPVHLDGLSALGRIPSSGTSLQLFAGLPARPRFGARDWDWAVGGRLAQDIGRATVGLGYLQQRDAGQLEFHELGVDFAVFPVAWLDLGARAAVDVISPALAELVATIAVTVGPVRGTLGAVHRSPSHLLPATSLFSVLGDRATRSFDLRLDWQAAPRLTLSVAGGPRLYDDVVYEDLLGRAELRLARDAAGGLVGLELHRQGAPGGGWSGARAYGRLPLVAAVAVSAELELVRADAPGDRGELWPWGLLAVSWRPHVSWELAAAAEARSTPEVRYGVDALLRASYLWSEP